MFAIGGTNAVGGTPNYLTTIEEATDSAAGVLGAFPNAPTGGSLSGARSGQISGVTGNHAWHIGGDNSVNPVNTIDQSTLP